MKILSLALLTLGLTNCTDIKCTQGEVSDINGICIQPRYIEGCQQYASQQKCAKCESIYKLSSSGLCEYSKQSNQPCCLSKNNEGKCIECNTGLKLNSDGSCSQNRIIGCVEKTKRGCVNCASDYFLENGICLSGIRHCIKYLQKGETSKYTSIDLNADNQADQVCTECKPNFSLINNACVKNKILGCQNEINHKCLKCHEPFEKKQEHCEIKNCVSYNDFGCTACDCGYFLNFRNVCEEIHAGCIRYQRGVCNDCHTNFKLKGTSCVMEGCAKLQLLECSKCSDGYELDDGGCKLKNCTTWNEGVCYACDQGFVPQSGKCVEDTQSKISSK